MKPLKFCEKHDILKEYKEKRKRYYCKYCQMDYRKKYELIDKERYLKYQKKYRQVHIDSISIKRKANYKKNIEKEKKYHSHQVNSLPDSYVKKFLVQRTCLRRDDIPTDLIELTRALILIRRTLKETKNGNNKYEKSS